MFRIVVACSALLACLAGPASAKEPVSSYPSKSIRFIVPVPAGGGVDVAARMVADGLSRTWGQSVIVENRPGAGGNIGAEFVSRAAPDGYTFLVAPPAVFVVNAALYKSLRYDPAKLQHVTITSGSPNVLAVGPNSPHKSARDLLDFIKKNPGKVSYASQGIGTTSHLTSAWLQQTLDSELVHVPYAGTAPALNDLAAGHVDMMIADLGSILSLAQAGKLTILAATTEKPVDAIPDVPTLISLGLKDFVSETWTAIAAPPGTPPEIAAKVADAVREIVRSPQVSQRFKAMSVEPLGVSPQRMSEIVRAESERWKAVAQRAKIAIE